MSTNANEAAYVNVKDLLLAILKKTGIILIVAVLLCGALFAYKFSKNTLSGDVLDTSVMLEDETDAAFDIRKAKVERLQDLINTISKVEAQIENQRCYITDSVYMQIDAENEYEANIQFVYNLKNVNATGLDSTLIAAYEGDIKAGAFLNDYADKIGTRADYIKELISISSTSTNSTVVTLDSQVGRAGSMYIKVFGPTKEYVDEVSDLVTDEILRVSEELSSSVAPHTISVVGSQTIVKIDASTRDGQVNQIAKLETLQKQVISYNDSLTQLSTELGFDGSEVVLEYYQAKEDAENSGTPFDYSVTANAASAKIKSAVKFGLIGFAAGVFLSIVVIVLRYIFAKKITTQAQFFSVFTDIKKIGVLKPSGKRSGFTKFVDVKSEDDFKMSDENNRKLICANYGNITKGKKILITGTGDSKAMSEAFKAMGLKGDFKPDIFSNPDVLRSVSDYDVVVLMEQRNVSLYKTVKNEISLISNSGVEIIGAIII